MNAIQGPEVVKVVELAALTSLFSQLRKYYS